MPSAAAIGKSAQGASGARNAEQDAGERRIAEFVRVSHYANLQKTEGAGEAQHHAHQSAEPALRERAQQAVRSARLDAPRAQRGRAEEEQGAGEPASGGEPD